MKDRIARLWGRLRGRRPLGATAMTLGEGVVVDGRFAIRRLLGIGGTSAVYVAQQVSMGRDVALKVLRSELLTREQATERFVREVRAVSRLTSPHTISVYDVGRTEDGLLYIAMELLKGQSLFRLMTEEAVPMSAWRAVALVDQVLNSLEEAHQVGVLHRDLKPENIFVIPGAGQTEFAKVLDFGIAQLGDDAEGRDSDRSLVVGTPRYMSPEQMEGKPLDARSDLYSLATILFELIAGRPPFEAATPVALALRKIQEVPPPLRQVHPRARIPDELEAFLHRALSRDPDRRPRDASEFKNLLALAMEGFGEDEPEAAPEVRQARPVAVPQGVGRGDTTPGEDGSRSAVQEGTSVQGEPRAAEPRPRPFDRRGATRVQRTMTVRFSQEGREYRATTTDVSAGGAFLFSRFLPIPGTQVEVIFENPGHTAFKIHMIGEVVRVVERPAAPGEVRGFAVAWVFSPHARRPKTLEELFATGL